MNRKMFNKCYICGNEWFTIKDAATLLREAKCNKCGASIRNSDLAKEIINTFSPKSICLKDALPELAGYRILNTCSSGFIHDCLHHLPGYIASEYYDDIPNGQSKGNVVSADLMNLPFKNESFDLVISEDVFEHIFDYNKGFLEVRRVLIPGGYHIFTIPLHEGRKTVSRIGNEKKIYHGDPIRKTGALVITDFGSDITDILEKIHFSTKVIVEHRFYKPNEITDADKTYEEYEQKIDRMDEYFKYNSVVFISKKISLILKSFSKFWAKENFIKLQPSEKLRAKYMDCSSIMGFDANVDIESPDGCYELEGDSGKRYSWASPRVSFILKINNEKSILHINGHVNMDIYKTKEEIKGLKIEVIINDKTCGMEEYEKSGELHFCIILADYSAEKYIPVTICASNSICPKLDGIGNDERHLSWILNSIYVE